MDNYVNKNAANIGIAELSLCLLNKLNEKFKEKDIDLNKRDNTFSIPIVTPATCPYCHEAIVAVQRSYKAFGWNCRMTHYTRRENMETKEIAHGFVFTFSKINVYNLPF